MQRCLMKDQQAYAVVAGGARWQLRVARWLPLAWRQLRRWQQLAAQRRQLASLSDAALKDLGISRADAYQEAERPFWDDPLRR
jgi:uncharacterized protein YjiS (DUF1127 family)